MPSSSTPVSTACEPAAGRPSLAETFGEMVRGQLPNFFRLYLNPFVVQTCYCLSRYVETTWPARPAPGARPSFLANSFDEALAGAIKLARFSGTVEGRSPAGLVLDPGARLGPFASVTLEGGGRVEFVPDVTVAGDASEIDARLRSAQRFGFVILVPSPGDPLDRHAEALSGLIRQAAPLLITCVDRPSLAACRAGSAWLMRELTPDGGRLSAGRHRPARRPCPGPRVPLPDYDCHAESRPTLGLGTAAGPADGRRQHH